MQALLRCAEVKLAKLPGLARGAADPCTWNGAQLPRGLEANNEAFYAARVRAWALSATHNKRHFSFNSPSVPFVWGRRGRKGTGSGIGTLIQVLTK